LLGYRVVLMAGRALLKTHRAHMKSHACLLQVGPYRLQKILTHKKKNAGRHVDKNGKKYFWTVSPPPFSSSSLTLDHLGAILTFVFFLE